MYKIKTLNNIAQIGLDEFNPKHYQVASELDDPDAILVRSHDMHGMLLPASVEVVGRAGAGINNIPVDELTKQGIPVMNTPGANANAVKELVITGMLLACRNICSAWEYTRHLDGDDETIHAQVEKHKKQFAGFELPGKTLAVVGLGHIGVKVANVGVHLGMKVIGYDPAITVRNAWELSSSVIHAESLDELLPQADFITFHIPLIEATRHLINQTRLQKMKTGVVLLNFARDGIIDNRALADAIDQKQVSTYVCDFPVNIFQHNPHVICLPHLGASTKEAEENCAVMIAQQVQDYLENGHIHNSVNFPAVKLLRTEGFRLAIANANVPNMVAQISTALSEKENNIVDMINRSRGEIAYTLIDVNNPIDDETLANIRAIKGVIRARRL